MRTYELALVLDPRLTDEQVGEMVDEYKALIVGTEGVEVTKEESWGKRKLAYPINKVSEGRYIFLYVRAEQQAPQWAEVERRLSQSEHVLRYLTVRTDRDLLRAVRKGRQYVPAAEAVGITGPAMEQPKEVQA